MKKKTKFNYSIGIDLGTSNCALSYISLTAPEEPSVILKIPQWETTERSFKYNVLPSFAYYPTIADQKQSPSDTISEKHIVGHFARAVSTQSPERVIQSAKSWFCHKGIDREAKILPWLSKKIYDRNKLSPVEASALYLSYLRDVWNQEIAEDNTTKRFDKQQIVVTVPASFDQDAQKLTLEAAKLAGYPKQVRLLEEPQAAFHAWIEKHPEPEALKKILPQKAAKEPCFVLVCDIGGGTTDLSLFSIVFDEDSSAHIDRIAVSDHILLGGDNIDITIAKTLEPQLVNDSDQLSSRKWQSLINQSRALKERALGESDDEIKYHVSISDTGSSLFTQTRTASILKEEIIKIVNNGFFPLCSKNERPESAQSGLKEMDLPYSQESAVTKHLSEFLSNHENIDAVLFNGGALKPLYLQKRIVSLIAEWQGGYQPVILENTDLDLTVSRGAAHYGRDLAMQRQKLISAGASHGFYLELQASEKKERSHLLCILPLGTGVEDLQRITNIDLQLLVNQPVEFRPYSSIRRKEDHLGQLLKFNAHDFRELPPLQTIARLDKGYSKITSKTVSVTLEAQLNALGLLQVYLVSNEKKMKNTKRWELEFNLRSVCQEHIEKITEKEPEPLPDSIKEEVFNKLNSTFNQSLIKDLEKITGKRKNQWNRLWLRQFWKPLFQNITKRYINAEYEAGWLHAAGFFLRPGYGVALDDYCMEQLWSITALEISHPLVKSVKEQYFVMWRRVSGGLSSEQQLSLFNEASALIKSHVKKAHEAVRMVCSFELLPFETKKQLFELLLEGIELKIDKYCEPYLWGLGRLLSRVPLYAGEDSIMPSRFVEMGFLFLKELDWTHPGFRSLTSLFSIACRKTKHRTGEIAHDLRSQVLEKMRISGATEKQIMQVSKYIPLEQDDLNILFGEILPSGLLLTQK